MLGRISRQSFQFLLPRHPICRFAGTMAVKVHRARSSCLLDIPVVYEPKDVESRWITYWEKHVNLRPHPESDKEFSMVLLSDYPNLTDPSASERDGKSASGSCADKRH